jgi:hypothetical protein
MLAFVIGCDKEEKERECRKVAEALCRDIFGDSGPGIDEPFQRCVENKIRNKNCTPPPSADS